MIDRREAIGGPAKIDPFLPFARTAPGHGALPQAVNITGEKIAKSGVWPTASQPTPYGTAKVQKIAILMTDGIYNTLQGQQYDDYSSQAATALSQAKSICSGMKAKAITVYTVGFNLDSTAAKNMLKDCASSSDHYYDTSGGDALKAAFRDIALKVSKLRLTN